MMKNQQDFNPSGVGVKGRLFGLPFTPNEARVVVIPVPWDVTVSYGAGTAGAPRSVLEASPQMDFYHELYPDIWKAGFAMDDFPEHIERESKALRLKTARYIEFLESGGKEDAPEWSDLLFEVNSASEKLNDWLKERVLYWRSKGKIVATLGGDHSTPLGAIRGHAEQQSGFGVLQIDAHADLRRAYEGFTYSHASIMYNALELPQIEKLVVVGLRDFCEEEQAYMNRHAERIVRYTNWELKRALFDGTTWEMLCKKIVESLPDRVYVSFDIDGLSPELCPNTGTPVPGGLSFDQVFYLIYKVVESGREIIGFDLNEVGVSENEWDENVGFRILYHLSACSVLSSKSLV